MFSPMSNTKCNQTVFCMQKGCCGPHLRMKHHFTARMEEKKRWTVLTGRDGMTSPQHRAWKSTTSPLFFVTFHSQREDFIFSHREVEAQARSHRRACRLMQPVHCLWWWSFGLLIYLITPAKVQDFLSEMCRMNVLKSSCTYFFPPFSWSVLRP